jgi:MSHA biogenesis protein MshP
MNKIRYKEQGTRYKVQGTRYKVQGSGGFSCTLHLASAESGFSLISAIFLLVVIAALGTFAVTLSTSQQQSAALDVLGSRAYQASRAGVEWGAYQALQNNSCSTTTTLTGLPNTLSGFSVKVDCSSAATSEASATVTMYQIISTATQGTAATPNYVERQMSVAIAQ